MSLTVKAYFCDEIRRIPVDASNASSYDYIEGKIRAAFPNLPPRGQVRLQWKDCDGDVITFSTDDELVEALSSSENGVFRVYLARRDTAGEHIRSGIDGLVGAAFDLPTALFGPGARGGSFNRSGCKNASGENEGAETGGEQNAESPAPGDYPFHFGARGGCGGRGRGRFRRWMSAKGGLPSDMSAGEEADAGKTCGKDRLFTPEELEKIGKICETVKQAAKTKAFEVAGATAGDCAGDAVVIAVRSSIRRAKMISKRSGFKPGCGKNKKLEIANEKLFMESSSNSDSSDSSDVEDEKVQSGDPSKKCIKKRAKAASKSVSKLAYKEVCEHFGKMAAKWAALAVSQTMCQSIKMTVKFETRKSKKEARKADKKAGKYDLECEFLDDGMETMDATFTFVGKPEEAQSSKGQGKEKTGGEPSAPTFMCVNNVPIYPRMETEVPLVRDQGKGDSEAAPKKATPEAEVTGASADDVAVAEAIEAFKRMGFTPDAKLVEEIQKAKGNIAAVFENMRR